MSKIENLEKIFTKKIPEVKNLDYWQRLKFLKMLSQERRMERYRTLYVWKILKCLTVGWKERKRGSDQTSQREAKHPNFKREKLQGEWSNTFYFTSQEKQKFDQYPTGRAQIKT